MASGKKKARKTRASKPKDEASDCLDAAWSDLLHALKDAEVDAPHVLRALAAMRDALDDVLGVAPDEADEVDDRGFDDGFRPKRKQTGRHDGKKAPSGHTFMHGELWKNRTLPTGAPNPRLEGIALSIVATLACWLDVEGQRGHPLQLASLIDPMLRRASGSAQLEEHASQLEKAYAALFGGDYGEAFWWEDTLVGQLEMDARHREKARLVEAFNYVEPPLPEALGRAYAEMNARLDALRGGAPRGAWKEPASGAEILDYLRHAARKASDTLPDALTAEAIEVMREKTGVVAGGVKGKKTAKSVVKLFADSVRKRAKRVRGNS